MIRIYIAHRWAERQFIMEQIVPRIEALGMQPVLVIEGSGERVEEAQTRWRLMDSCQAALIWDALSIISQDATLHFEMGLMMGWARHVVARAANDAHPFSKMPWVINIEGSEFEDLDNALMELRARLEVPDEE